MPLFGSIRDEIKYIRKTTNKKCVWCGRNIKQKIKYCSDKCKKEKLKFKK